MTDPESADGGGSDDPRVAVTGTPGTGKTTATERLGVDAPVHHLNDLIRQAELHDGRDPERDSLVVDIDAVAAHLGDWRGVAESHLAHRLPADRVVVLRCHPGELRRRLRERGADPAEIDENAESEALDVILTEAVQRHGPDAVYEVDATDSDPGAVAAAIERVVAGDATPRAGTVDFTDALHDS